MSPALIRTAWEAIREDANFGCRIIRHDFRATYRSVGSDLGEDFAKEEVLIGHSLGTVVDLYHFNHLRVLGEVNDKVSAELWKMMKLPKLPKPKKAPKK